MIETCSWIEFFSVCSTRFIAVVIISNTTPSVDCEQSPLCLKIRLADRLAALEEKQTNEKSWTVRPRTPSNRKRWPVFRSPGFFRFPIFVCVLPRGFWHWSQSTSSDTKCVLLWCWNILFDVIAKSYRLSVFSRSQRPATKVDFGKARAIRVTE